jgi:hypothetical protein
MNIQTVAFWPFHVFDCHTKYRSAHAAISDEPHQQAERQACNCNVLGLPQRLNVCRQKLCQPQSSSPAKKQCRGFPKDDNQVEGILPSSRAEGTPNSKFPEGWRIASATLALSSASKSASSPVS